MAARRETQPDQPAEIKAAAGKAGEAHIDRVLAVSRHADGSPAQSDGFKSVNPELTEKISEAQLREQAVSAADHAVRSELVADAEPYEDPVNKALREAHESAAGSVKTEKVGK